MATLPPATFGQVMSAYSLAITLTLSKNDPVLAAGGIFFINEIADITNKIHRNSYPDFYVDPSYLGHGFVLFYKYLKPFGWEKYSLEKAAAHRISAIGEFEEKIGQKITVPQTHNLQNHSLVIDFSKFLHSEVYSVAVERIHSTKVDLLSSIKCSDTSTSLSEFCHPQNICTQINF